MGLPPVTPAPSRFLVSKKPSAQKPQSQTPNAQYTGGPSQFHATPRFSATPRPSSTQPGSAFKTPALAIKSRVPTTRSTQDIIDDSSPSSVEEGSPSASPTTRDALPEPIEFDSSLVPQSPLPSELKEGRSPKRRRISIASSEPETDPPEPSQESEETDLGSLPDAPDHSIISYRSNVDGSDDDLDDNDDAHISPSQSISSTPTHSPFRRVEVDDEEDENDDDDASDQEDSETETTSEIPKRHNIRNYTNTKPAFHPAPRFKPTEPPDSKFPHDHPDTTTINAYLTADIFSPQRRGGTKYLPGGLAAELRDWLVDVKGGVDGEGEVAATSCVLRFTSSSGGPGGVVRVVVEEVSRGGVGMKLVCGRLLVEDEGGGARVRVILAGEGNIEGLGGGAGKGSGKRGRVEPGAVVAVVPPAWDVELDGTWAVAYRWEVVKGVDGDGG